MKRLPAPAPTPPTSAAFTLLEVLVALVLLSIGGTAIFQGFVADGVLHRKEREGLATWQYFHNQAELLRSTPRRPNDSSWIAEQPEGTYLSKLGTLDSADVDRMGQASQWSQNEILILAHRPRELLLETWLYPREARIYPLRPDEPFPPGGRTIGLRAFHWNPEVAP